MIGRSGSLAVAAVLPAALCGCAGGSSPANNPRPTEASTQPGEASGGAQTTSPPTSTGASALLGIGDEGSFTWRCDGSRTRIEFKGSRATETVEVRAQSKVFKRRTVQPGQAVSLQMSPGTTSQWTVVQATEPATLSAGVTVTTRSGRCLVYLPPETQADLKTASHSGQ